MAGGVGGLQKLKCVCMEAGVSLSALAGYEPLNELDERDERDKDSETEKQEELLFYNDDGSAQSVLVESNLRAADLCLLLAVKNRVAKDVHWTLIEHWPEFGLERSLEDHEDVLSVHHDMKNFSKYSERRFVFRKDFRKYEFFHDPQQFFPADMVVDLEGSEDLPNNSILSYTVALQAAMNGAEDSPPVLCQVWVRDSNKQVWAKAYLLLKDRSLYISYKVQMLTKFLRHFRRIEPSQHSGFKGDADGGVQLLCRLKDYTVYSCLNARNQLRAPTEWGLCLRPSGSGADVPVNGLGGSTALKCLACDSERVRTCLLTAMRLAKYGRQLRENYRTFKNKQAESINSKEYNSYSVPVSIPVPKGPNVWPSRASTSPIGRKFVPSVLQGQMGTDRQQQAWESVRSRVAMDFTGAVGRIVEDPKEAKAIAAAEGYSWKRRLRRGVVGMAPGSLGPQPLGLESGIHVTQPWFHSGMTREQATQLVSRHGTVDGVFLVRESRSNPGAFVLTFKCSGKVLHTQIQPVVDPIREALCYSLDSGVTKFYDVLQLVEFYQLNAGCLPTRLTHYVVQSPAFHNNNLHQRLNNNNLSGSGSSRSSSTPSSPCASFRGSGVALLAPDPPGPPCASF